MTAQEWMIVGVKAFFLVAVVVAVVFYVIVPLWRGLRSGPDAEMFNPTIPSLDDEADELEIPTDGKSGKPDRLAIIDQAKGDPRVTATMVSRWLKQKD